MNDPEKWIIIKYAVHGLIYSYVLYIYSTIDF